ATTGLPKAAAGTPLPVCLTGEDLPMKTADQARAKQDALLKRIAQASGTGYPSSVDTTALLQKLVINAKLTFEAAGGGFAGAPGDVIEDATLGDQIAASLALYTRYSSAPYTPTCGHSPAP